MLEVGNLAALVPAVLLFYLSWQAGARCERLLAEGMIVGDADADCEAEEQEDEYFVRMWGSRSRRSDDDGDGPGIGAVAVEMTSLHDGCGGQKRLVRESDADVVSV